MDKLQQSQFIFRIVICILAKPTSNNEEETGERKRKQYGSDMCAMFSCKTDWTQGFIDYVLIVPCITAIDDLVSTVFDERTLQFGTGKTLSDDLAFKGTPLFHGNPFVVRRQASLPLLVSEKKKRWTNRKKNGWNMQAQIIVLVPVRYHKRMHLQHT